MISIKTSVSSLINAFKRPIYGLPVDMFRVLVGFLCCAYFLRTFFETEDFSNMNGLIDHEYARQIFWYTKLSLFQLGTSLIFFKIIFLLASLLSLMIVLGYRVKLIAGILFSIAVSTYRWNFMVMYIDDVIMHLMIFWILLLPVGRTLVFSEWLVDKQNCWERWKYEVVPGTAVRCFLINLALIYLVAGLWKFTSPMWHDGTALYAVLKLPISHHPQFWRNEYLPILKFANYFALVLEPLIPLMFILPTNHILKWVLLIGLLGFHVGIISTLKIPYANIACIAATVIIFRNELMGIIHKYTIYPQRLSIPCSFDLYGKLSLIFVTFLTLAMIGEVFMPEWRYPSRVDN